MSYFYIDLASRSGYRYDLSKFMPYSDGLYDEFDSYMLDRVRDLPHLGQYRIREQGRPDIYSRDIYRTVDHWQLLMIYNNAALLEDLKVGRSLLYPDINGIENIYFGLAALQRS